MPVHRPFVDTNEDARGELWAYAYRLVTAPGDLGFEEMFPLIGLLDDLEALKQCGLPWDASKESSLRELCLRRFSRQRQAAGLAAQPQLDGWKREWWHYRVLLKTGDPTQ
jgi:hypothetical protein